MPKTPTGAKRPADVTQNAVLVMKLATGQEKETATLPTSPAAELGRKGGLKGGKARAKSLTQKERSRIAKVAAKKRWAKTKS